MPEYRQGTNKIRVRLKDGRSYSSVFVAWGDEIVKVGTFNTIPFSAEEVVSVENDLQLQTAYLIDWSELQMKGLTIVLGQVVQRLMMFFCDYRG